MALDILGEGAPPAAETPPAVTGHGTSIDTSPPPVQGAPAGRPDYVPEQFWRALATDPTQGEVNAEAWGTAWKDTKGALTRTQQELAELRKQANLPSAPQSVDDYLTGYDLAQLRAASPKVIPEEDEAAAAGAREFFGLAHRHGLSVEQARGLFGDYMGVLDGQLPDPVDPKTVMEERIKALGSEGPQMAEQVDKAIQTMHGERPFTEEQTALLRDVVRAPGGLGLLWRTFRSGGSIAPPAVEARTGDRMTAYEIRQAMASDRYRQDDEYRQRIVDAHNAHTTGANGAAPPPTHRSLRLG